MLKTFNIFTIGCQMNKADSERLSGYLKRCGLKPTASANEADLVVLVTCGVRQTAEDRIYGLAPNILAKNKNAVIVLTGCLALRPDVRERLKDKVKWFFPINELPKLASVLGLPEPVENQGSLDYLAIKPDYQSDFSAFVPIGNGCNNFCSYCVVPYARGREVYRPHQDIIAEVKSLLETGFKEITLIAQNVNSYKSGNVNFAKLLAEVDALPGDFWLKFATSHPKDMSEELIETVARGNHLGQFFHVAAQSGDDDILKRMNRQYSAERFLDLVALIRQKSPLAYISTDLIVGFPGESDKQFKNTVKLMKAAKFDMAYIAQYSPRPGTKASDFDDDVSSKIKKAREQALNEILKKTAAKNNRRYLKRTVTVLVDEVKKKRDGFWASGKTQDFKSAIFPVSDRTLVGQFTEVLISDAEDFCLKGNLAQPLKD